MAKKYIKGKAAPLKEGQVRVKSGDSLWRLAAKYTGSGTNWKQLNGGKKLIKPGDIVDIPKNIWNPEVEIDGKKLRWRSKEYKEAYARTTDKEGDAKQARKDLYAGQAKKGGDAARKASGTFAKEAGATVMNAMDMPRRLVAATTNDDYSYKDALQFFGTQDYKSVVGDEYAAAHPGVAAAADIGTGLLAWNLPSITRSIAKTGVNASRNAATIAKHADDVARVNSTKYVQRARAVKDINKGIKSPSGHTAPNKEAFAAPARGSILPTPTVSTVREGSRGAGNVSGYTKVGKVSKGTGTKGQGSGWLSKRGNVGGGQVKGGHVQSPLRIPNVNMGPVQGPVYSPFIPIPGLPGGIAPPVITPEPKSRIETRTPGRSSLSELFIENNITPGDTMVMPGGEQIRYNPEPDSTWVPRYFDIEARNTYDEDADNVTNQNWIPRASDVTYKKGQKSVNKYYPAVPKGEVRTNDYYPEVVGGKPTYRPIKYQQGGKIKGDKMGNGKPLRSGFKKTTYISEHAKLKAKRDSLKALPNANKMKIKAKIYDNEQAIKDLKASQKPKVYIKRKKKTIKKQDGGVMPIGIGNTANIIKEFRNIGRPLGKFNRLVDLLLQIQ